MKLFITVALLSVFVSACAGSKSDLPEDENVEFVYRGAPAITPPGVVRYCWEEPIVQFDQEGPGVRKEGTWYQPAQIVGKEVRQGKWVPCKPYPDETKGE